MKKININRNWKFKFGRNEGDEYQLNEAEYDLIGLPHSFGIPYYGEKDFYVGYGCYSKKILVEELLNKQIYIEFGAVFQVAEIYVNGKYVGKHEGGYTAFIFDITEYLNQGENRIFVRVNNLWNPVIAPRAGEHTFNGGMYRDVYLIEYPVSHVAWYGVGVKTQKNEDHSFNINISVETVHCVGKWMEISISDAENQIIDRKNILVEKDEVSCEFVMKNPNIWDIENPYLYHVLTRVDEDELVTEFGIRTIEWFRERGFYLNGRHLLLDGANVHQDHGGWGDAVTQAGVKRDVAIMKECGFNFIRGSHYPHHNEFARECDRKGILLWSENVFWGIGGFGEDGDWYSSAMPVKQEEYELFEKSLRQQLKEMVRTNRNSPSIICWSMGNEIFFSKKEVLDDAKKMVGRLVEYCHLLDDTRPAGIGGVQREGFDQIGDIAGYNGDGAVLFKNPAKPSIVAEYGSIAGYRPGKYDLYETPGSDEYYDWRAGRAIWCGFHHGSNAEIGNLGICDLYRLPLNAYYRHRERLRGIKAPTPSIQGKATRLKIEADKTVLLGDGTDDAMLVVKVLDDKNHRIQGEYSITLEVLSGSIVFPTGKTMIFSREKKNCFDGMCAIEVRGYYEGKSIIQAKCEGLISDQIELMVKSQEVYKKQDIVYRAALIEQDEEKKRYVNAVENRPCITSSEKIEGSSKCLTSKGESFYWSPDINDSEPYILLDMEHCYKEFEIKINKVKGSELLVSIFTSIDKEDWQTEAAGENLEEYKIIHKSRYIKIRVNKNCKINKINVQAL